MNSFRSGAQVHAVPEDERAVDSRGQPLPWGYSYADVNPSRKQPLEKGPFGRTTHRRTVSRSKTVTPTTKEDLIKLENLQTIDDIFGKMKSTVEEKQPVKESQRVSSSAMPQARPNMDMVTTGAAGAAASQNRSFKEPTEVLLYGFGSDFQYAAIDYYETASGGGRIYEDYDRMPPNPRYNTALSTSRIHAPRMLPQAAMRKINTYQGGEHWIKVTFDSPEAAEAACHYSPHIIHGYLVHAELYRGSGPQADVAITANSANTSGAATLVQRKPSRTQPQERNTMPARLRAAQMPPQPWRQDSRPPDSVEFEDSSGAAITTGTDHSNGATVAQVDHNQSSVSKPLRIPTATRAILLPATSALLPVLPWTARTFGHLPLIGPLFGGDHSHSDMIGGAVPRNQSGGFDWEKASVWWRVCWLLDSWFGTDMCGMKGDD